MVKIVKKGYHMYQKLGRTEEMIKVGNISEKCDILTVEEKRIARIVNRTKSSLEMTTRQKES